MDFNDDNVRDPDPIKVDKLINNSFDEANETEQLVKILELSKNEYNNFQDIYEKNIIDNLIQESKERATQFTGIKQKLNKMLVFDKENAQVYETILSAIEFYIEGYLIHHNINKEEYDKTFSVLKMIRLTKEELILLQNLIVIEE